jgi:putative ABC transport system permease protein
MLRITLLLAWRALVRNGFFSGITLVGLAISYVAFHALWQYASRELEADAYHPNAEHIYRLSFTWRYSDDGETFKEEEWAPTLFVAGPWFKQRFQEIEDFTRIVTQPRFRPAFVGHTQDVYFEYESPEGNKVSFREESMVYADKNLFSFFHIPLLYGAKETVLTAANAVVVSQSVAQKYFGTERAALGKLLLLNGQTPHVVTGVFEDLPNNTHLAFDIVLSTARFADTFTAFEFAGCANLYMRVNETSDRAVFIRNVKASEDDFWAPIHNKYQREKAGHVLRPLKQIAYTSGVNQDTFTPKSKATLNILRVVAVLILAMGWVNYVNLGFSIIMKRLKELASRKTFGAMKLDFFLQFFLETLLTNVVALALAMAIYLFASGALELYTGITVPRVVNPWATMWQYAVVILAGTVLVSVYPALLAGSLNINVLFRTTATTPGAGRSFVNGITVFQYGISICLIMWVFLIDRQMDFVLHAETGFNRDNVIVIDGPMNPGNNHAGDMHSLANQVKRIAGVRDVTYSHTVPGDKTYQMVLLARHGRSENAGLYTNGGVDDNFMSFYGVRIIAGRDFAPDKAEAANAMLLSEVGAKRLGFSTADEAVGQRVVLDNWNNPLNNGDAMEIIGVFADYRLGPFVKAGTAAENDNGSQGLFITKGNTAVPMLLPNRISVRIDGMRASRIMEDIESEFKTIFPHAFFNWYFLEEHVNRAYTSQLRFRNQLIVFTVLAIIIACLGVLGTIAFLAASRVREVSLRRIFGANAANLAWVMARTMMYQTIAALILALPHAFYFINRYLEAYTTRVSMHWSHVALPVLMMVLLFGLVIAPVVHKVLRLNPARMLRNS